jgi:hypothetical protein
MICACGYKREFKPNRGNQIYFSPACRQRDKNRRWPRTRIILPAASRNGRRAHKTPRRSGGTPLLGSAMAPTRPRTILWATGAFFGFERQGKKSRAVLQVRGLVVSKFDLLGKGRDPAKRRAGQKSGWSGSARREKRRGGALLALNCYPARSRKHSEYQRHRSGNSSRARGAATP